MLFDGAFLGRKGLMMGWLVSTVFKICASLSLGVVCAFLISERERLAANSDDTENEKGILKFLRGMSESYLSCCLLNLDGERLGSGFKIRSRAKCLLWFSDQKTLFFVIYSITFFAVGCEANFIFLETTFWRI